MKKIPLLFLLSFCTYVLFAQEESADNSIDDFPIFLGVYPSFSIPMLDFQESMSRVGLGGGLEFLININNSPLLLGASSTISNFGHASREFIDNDGFELAWKTNSSLWDFHLVLQVEPPFDANFQPYIQGKVGFNHFFTITRLVDLGTSSQDDGTLERLVDDTSWGLSYGGAIGSLFPLDQDWRFMLNTKISYLRGREASFYAKQDTFTIVGDTLDAFDLAEAAVDMLRLEVGILVYIR